MYTLDGVPAFNTGPYRLADWDEDLTFDLGDAPVASSEASAGGGCQVGGGSSRGAWFLGAVVAMTALVRRRL